MELKVSEHDDPKRDGAVLNDAVCELKSSEDSKPQKVEGSYCSFLQISDTLAETHNESLHSGKTGHLHKCLP
jgi:hypothetical protein